MPTKKIEETSAALSEKRKEQNAQQRDIHSSTVVAFTINPSNPFVLFRLAQQNLFKEYTQLGPAGVGAATLAAATAVGATGAMAIGPALLAVAVAVAGTKALEVFPGGVKAALFLAAAVSAWQMVPRSAVWADITQWGDLLTPAIVALYSAVPQIATSFVPQTFQKRFKELVPPALLGLSLYASLIWTMPEAAFVSLAIMAISQATQSTLNIRNIGGAMALFTIIYLAWTHLGPESGKALEAMGLKPMSSEIYAHLDTLQKLIEQVLSKDESSYDLFKGYAERFMAGDSSEMKSEEYRSMMLLVKKIAGNNYDAKFPALGIAAKDGLFNGGTLPQAQQTAGLLSAGVAAVSYLGGSVLASIKGLGAGLCHTMGCGRKPHDD